MWHRYIDKPPIHLDPETEIELDSSAYPVWNGIMKIKNIPPWLNVYHVCWREINEN